MVASPHSIEQVSIDLVFPLPVVFYQVDYIKEVPQISCGKSQSMLLVGGLFEDISCFDRLQLVKVTKQKHAEAPKHIIDHGDLSQAEVEVIKHVCRYHADLVNNDAPQISKQKPLFSPLLLRHGEEGGAKLEAEQGVEGLPIYIGRCSASK